MNLNAIHETFNLASYYPSIKKLGVFGSYSRGDEHENSDIDILIEYDESVDDYIYNIGRFMEDIEQKISMKIDYVTLNGLMKSSDPTFIEHVLRDVKWLYIANN